MIEQLLIFYATYLEKKGRKIKKKLQNKRTRGFIDKYRLIEVNKSIKTDLRFNSYEGTNLYLIDELIKAGIINKDDKITDVGCGTGIFMIYLSHLGYDKVQGIEFDRKLYDICIENVRRYNERCNEHANIEIYHKNALEFDYDEKCSCFYLFNTFYDKDTYVKWIEQIENSVRANPRKIKIIILYPTVASMGAMRTRKWLKETQRILCKAQYCYNCMHFIVYEGGENIENIVDLNNQ